MSIYSVNGRLLASAYDKPGDTLNSAYAIDGDLVFSQTRNIKVMTYNVGQWYYGGHIVVPADKDAEYYALQRGMIVDNDPDILCLEEYLSEFSATGRSAYDMLRDIFPYVHEVNGTGTVTSGTGRCICSKYPISNYVTHQYSQAGAPRYFDSCTITIHGVPVTCVITHLNYNATDSSIRVNQLNELIAFLQTQTRFISCGDYNTLDCKTTSGADYTSMIVPLLNAGFHCANCSNFGFMITYSDQPTGTYTGCLDNIVTSNNITITDAYVDETKLSDGLTERTDHMPLIATITI